MSGYFAGFIATPTKVRSFLECSRKYWYSYINPETRQKQPEKSYFTLGHHVHDALRDFLTLSPEERRPPVLFKLLEDRWLTKSGPEAGFTTPEEEATAKNKALLMLKWFVENEDWKDIKPVLLPNASDGKIPGFVWDPIGKNLAFGGVIDRMDRDLDGGLHIIDYKTGKHDVIDEWQLPIYAVLMGRRMNEPIAKTSYLFLHHGKRHTEEITIEKNVETIKRVEEVVSRIPNSKNKEDFVCLLGDRCRHCDYLLELGFDPITGKRIE